MRQLLEGEPVLLAGAAASLALEDARRRHRRDAQAGAHQLYPVAGGGAGRPVGTRARDGGAAALGPLVGGRGGRDRPSARGERERERAAEHETGNEVHADSGPPRFEGGRAYRAAAPAR